MASLSPAACATSTNREYGVAGREDGSWASSQPGKRTGASPMGTVCNTRRRVQSPNLAVVILGPDQFYGEALLRRVAEVQVKPPRRSSQEFCRVQKRQLHQEEALPHQEIP